MNRKRLIASVLRRRDWIFGRIGPRQTLNLASAAKDFALKRDTVKALPAVVKIDISPLCNLRCTACVHSDPNGNPTLEKQVFAPGHKMTVAQFSSVIDQIRGKTASVSLYYLGDPMVHPDLVEMCRIAADAGLQVHISTNFSFGLKDEKIWEIVKSGLTHLTVCIDGLSQEKYQRTRVGGNIARVRKNLERVCRFRKEIGSRYPLVEVQYIKFRHNVDEMDEARRICEELGVDRFSDFWGDLHNWTDRDPGHFDVLGPKPTRRLPLCYWPHFSTVIKWNGDVIPCCTHRQGSQYAPGEDARVFGNVFEKNLVEIWNSKAYRIARQMVSNPSVSGSSPEYKNHFCAECPVIFETTRRETMLPANELDFEQVFTLDERGRPIRRPPSELEELRVKIAPPG
jgi:MoaA/NifB/PqqE/SkfB family radical SAM enzyme